MKTLTNIWFLLYASATIAVILILLLGTLGCHTVSYSRNEPNGEKIAFSSSSLWTKKQIGDVQYGASTNGTRQFKLKGYTDDQTAVAIQALIAALQAYTRTPVVPVP